MPTVPAATPSGVGDSHRLRAVAEGFGADAERYDRARPRYPATLAGAVLAGLPERGPSDPGRPEHGQPDHGRPDHGRPDHVRPGWRVLDVGIGTGISALPFRDAGATVLGVDPDARMARVARARGFEVEIGTFEEWDPAGRSFDAVVAGQAWHWVDPVEGAAKAASALAPGGRLAVFWNAGDPPPELAAAFADIYRAVDTGLPFTPWTAPQHNGYAAFLDKTADGIQRAGGYGTPERLRFDWRATLSRDDFLDQVPTAGGHNRIAEEKLTRLLAGLGAAIDAAGGSFPMEYATVALVATRLR